MTKQERSRAMEKTTSTTLTKYWYNPRENSYDFSPPPYIKSNEELKLLSNENNHGLFKTAVELHLYRNSKLEHNNYVFVWNGEVTCYYRKVDSNVLIEVFDYSPAIKALENFKKEYNKELEYHPVWFWKIQHLGAIGRLEFDNIINKDLGSFPKLV